MGGKLGRFVSGNSEHRLVMVGLDSSGKTTLLYQMELGKFVSTIPTVGMNFKHLKYKNLHIAVWDLGGLTRIRPLWHHYVTGCKGIIFVLDSADTERFNEAAKELRDLLHDEQTAKAILLVLANKQDLEGAQRPEQIAERLAPFIPAGKIWRVQGVVAASGEGLTEGFDWMYDVLKNKKKDHSGSVASTSSSHASNS
mmetsp:Transcript_26810/g.46220  ORF Transcript_26810/g.46220 Transcript_26810/m.46220 type:complete len:197 (+) Transcript_26810:79-669(+)